MARGDPPEPQIYHLRAVLRGISPLIWRRLLKHDPLFQALRAIELCEIPIERTKRKVPRPTSSFQDQRIRKADRRSLPELLKRRCHYIGVLKSERLMIKQHINRTSDLFGGTLIHRIEHPSRLRQHEVRHPRSA